MKFRLAIRAAAREDIRGARDWYEDQAVGLGEKFGEALDGAITLITENPMMFPSIQGRARRALMRRFPYAIYFVVDGGGVSILRILHQARDPRTAPA
jgi:plasmid stabilization system protein ParE